MKSRLLLTTALAFAGLATGHGALAAPPTRFPDTAEVSARTSVRDPRLAAERFVEHINYARVALAMKNPQRAEDQLTSARRMMSIVRGEPEVHTIAKVGSGRLVYEKDTDYKYHYFPIETGPIEIKKMGKGPFWANKGLAVTDAEIVYVTLDLSGTRPDDRMNAAENDIRAGKLGDADQELAELTEDVVSVDDDEEAVPLDKARDNIMLARDFIATGNYDGARYALRHADDALDDMARDKHYTNRGADISRMRRDVNHLEHTIARNNPSLLQKADAKMAAWWHEMKGWAQNDQRATLTPSR